MSEVNKNILTLLLDKPMEPILVPKGENNIHFSLPDKHVNKKYRRRSDVIKKKYAKKNAKTVRVKDINIPSSVTDNAAQIENFCIFIAEHIEAAGELIKSFMEAETIEDLLSIAIFCRERVKPLLFNYALSVALLHRDDTHDVILPNFISTFPSKFVEASVFTDVRREANLIPAGAREPIVIRRNFTANGREPEQAVAYFREDVGINLHHWHWHLVYPTGGLTSTVNKDRRGELFYYMHQQVLARYNVERFCNDLPSVVSIASLRESITEGYFSKLHQLNSNRAWPPRFKHTYLEDLDRPNDRMSLSIQSLEQWLDNIKQAIRDKKAKRSNGTEVNLDPVNGIDILGNMIESSILSVNRTLYGNFHNAAHVLIAYCHDPDGRYMEGMSLMGDVATAMRDPVFYRLHNWINDLFVDHKKTLPPYTKAEIGFSGIKITDLHVDNEDGARNVLSTFWEMRDIDLSRGLDFVPQGPLTITITHLQHAQFTYTITVNNDTNQSVKGTMRLFMSPKYDIYGSAILFEYERQFAIELDKFTVQLNPGQNVIQRHSIESSVTVEYESTFRNIDTSRMTASALREHNFCGCGWPDHMLIPRGTPNGYRMNLFAMVSDYNNDRVDQALNDVCPGADSYCGLFNLKYPDRRSMGYPFDREPEKNVIYLSDFLLPNMMVREIDIVHEDRTVRIQNDIQPMAQVITN